MMAPFDDERVRDYHGRVENDPVYQQILEMVKKVYPEGYSPGVVIPPTQKQIEMAVRFFLFLENSVIWQTSCLNCSRMLDSSIESYERAERMAEALKSVCGLASEALSLVGFAQES